MRKSETVEKKGEELSGREGVLIFFDHNSKDEDTHEYADIEDLSSMTLQGNKLGKLWSAWTYVLRGFETEPSDA